MKYMKYLIYLIVTFAVVSILLSIWAGINSRADRDIANLYNQRLMLLYPLHLMTPENEEQFEEIIDLVDKSHEYNMKSLKFEAKERYWRASFEIFIVSLMLIFVDLSVLKGKQKELKFWIKKGFVVSLIAAFLMFFNPFFI